MADLKVGNLDDGVASPLRARAKAKGISLEAQICRTLDARRSTRRGRQIGARRRAHHPPRAGCRDEITP
jgi:plasmid stability protein